MSRPQDSIIDDDEESCPLCIEEFDLTDKNFKPCPCGYQICQFCYNSLKNTYGSTCPNCRRVYEEKAIQFRIPTKEDIVHDKENKARKQAATKRKEVEKREVETSNRRNLAGVRVKQQNLVYVIGLVPSVKDENTLLQTLRGSQYFGQYGEIEKIVVSKARPGATSTGIGVYITYASKEAAALCIEVVDGSMNGDRVLRAQYGTTKYCSAYLRGDSCNNKACTFLHETGEDGQNTTLQNEPTSASRAARIPPMQPPAQPLTINTLRQVHQQVQAQSRREKSKERAEDRGVPLDSSALPSSASWGSKEAPKEAAKEVVTRARRPSQTASKAVVSPKLVNVALPKKPEEATRKIAVPKPPSTTESPVSSVSRLPPSENQLSRPSSSGRSSPRVQVLHKASLNRLVSSAGINDFAYSFNPQRLNEEEISGVDRCSSLIEANGGARRRAMREKEAERLKAQSETDLMVSLPNDSDDQVESGSLALGGEPEEAVRHFSGSGAIQRPNNPTNQPDHFSRLVSSRSLTPQQRQAAGFPVPISHASPVRLFDDRPNAFSAQQYEQTRHRQQSSRYSFANDSVKPNPTHRYPNQVYTSTVQGPPPGLKSAGTPPVSGGGMFAQGHGFATNMATGFSTSGTKDNDLRGRSGAGAGHDLLKRSTNDLGDPNNLSRLHQGSGHGMGERSQGGYNQSNSVYGGGYGRW